MRFKDDPKQRDAWIRLHFRLRDKKPKKADFRYKKGRYWIFACDYNNYYADGTVVEFNDFIVRDYVTDEIVDISEDYDLLETAIDAGFRVMPPSEEELFVY